MKTSYKDCDPEIAEMLKNGEHVRCVSTFTEKKRTIIAYIAGDTCPYVAKDGTKCTAVSRVPTITKVISPVDVMRGLVDRGFVVYSDGTWIDKAGFCFDVEMWQYCGENMPGRFYWLPWMLEEMEDE